MRFFLRTLTTVVLLAAAGAASSAAAEDAGARSSLAIGVKAFEGGSPEAAIEALTQALQGQLSSRQAAKALYYRGLAYRALGRPGQAVADLDAAIAQTNGLSLTQLAHAQINRAGADREAAAGATARLTPPAAEDRQLQTAVREAQPQSFVTTTSIDPAERESSAWAAATVMPDGPARFATQVVPEAAAPAVEPPAAGGGIRVQVARVQSQSEAYAIAVRVMSQHGAEFDPGMLKIVKAVAENKPPVYLVRLGPFASVDLAKERCSSLRRTGFDCVVQY